MRPLNEMTRQDLEWELRALRARPKRRLYWQRIGALTQELRRRQEGAKIWQAETEKLAAMDRGCSSKKAYGTAEAAGVAAANRIAAGAEPLRTYLCRFCSQFHLTKTSLENYVAALEAS